MRCVNLGANPLARLVEHVPHVQKRLSRAAQFPLCPAAFRSMSSALASFLSTLQLFCQIKAQKALFYF